MGAISLLLAAVLALSYVGAQDENKSACKFSINQLHYDFCDIAKAGQQLVRIDERTPPTRTITEYRVSISGKVKWSDKTPAEEQCPDGTWVCQRVWNLDAAGERRLLKLVPIASESYLPPSDQPKPPGAPGNGAHLADFALQDAVALLAEDPHDHLNISATLGRQPKTEKHPPVVIRMNGGMYVNTNQQAMIQFWCDESVDDVSTPTFTWTWWGAHIFDWRTSKACATNGYGGHRHTPTDEDSNNPLLPGDGPGIFLGRVGRSPMFWFGMLSFTACAAYLLFHFVRRGEFSLESGIATLMLVPAAFLSCVRAPRRKKPSAERRQLLWAAEGLDEEAPPAFTALHRSYFDGEELDFEEADPLPSPTRSKMVPNYGIAPPRTYSFNSSPSARESITARVKNWVPSFLRRS